MDSPSHSPGEITRVLATAGSGNDGLGETFGFVYADLQAVARAQLARLRPGETLDTAALIHEAYLRMVDQSRVTWKDRSHFFAYSASVMRSVIVDYARRKSAAKRGSGLTHVRLEEGAVASVEQPEMILALDEALHELSSIDPRLEKVVDCRFFGGMTESETASAVGVSERTIRRDWKRARGWLYAYLAEDPAMGATR